MRDIAIPLLAGAVGSVVTWVAANLIGKPFSRSGKLVPALQRLSCSMRRTIRRFPHAA